MRDARQIICDELDQLPSQKKRAGSSLMIRCPFHDDMGPSCGINLSQDNGIPLGYFNCFGCNEKGPWNKIAKKLGLTVFKGWELDFTGNGSTREERRRTPEASMKSTDQQDRLYKTLKTKSIIPWPDNQEWRGYPGELLNKLGALMFSEYSYSKDEDDSNEIMLFFPIYVNSRFVGGVKAFMEKKEKRLSYLNTEGSWILSSGLLGFDYLRDVMKRTAKKRKKVYTSVVLVEGPRDVVRLLQNKIPGLAILGIQNFSEKKLIKILSMSSHIKRIYVMSDNDAAGKQMYLKIKDIAKGYIPVKRLKLPQDKDDEGNLIKMDPDSAPQEIIDSVRELIVSEMEWVE